MPVEIREINISMTLFDDAGSSGAGEMGKSGGADGPGASASSGVADSISPAARQDLVNACVRAVMQILREKGEA